MAYAFVKTGANAANSNSFSFTPTNAGDLLVVVIGTSGGGGNPTCTFSDNLSSSWQTAYATATSSTFFVSVFYLLNCSASITTLTGTFNGGTPGQCNIVVSEYSGLSSYLGISTANFQASPGTGSNAITSNNVNASSQPAMVFGFTYDQGQNNISAAGTSPLTFNGRYGFSQNTGVFTEDTRVTSTGNKVANCTTIHGTDSFTTLALAFAETASGTAYTLTAAMGSFGLTGEAALRGLAITAAEGSFALTGKTVTFQRAANIASEQGAFALTGNNATLTWNRSYIPSTLTLKGA